MARAAAAAADGQEKVIAAALHVVKNHATSTNDEFPPEAAARLDAAEKVICRWDACNFWESSSDHTAEYLSAVDEVILLTAAGGDLLGRAECVVQIAMARLEVEFQHLINRSCHHLDAGDLQNSFQSLSLSFPSDSGDTIAEDSDPDPSVEKEQQAAKTVERGGNSPSDDLISNLIPPVIMSILKDIADRMISAGCKQELCQAYSSAHREILNDFLSVLGVDKLSIKEVQKIERMTLDDKMKKWIHSLKIVVRVLLAGERKICDQIFAASNELKEECFMEVTKDCVIQLLKFGDAIAAGNWSLEKLFPILGMCKALVDVLPDLKALFLGNSKEFICEEVKGSLGRLGNAVRETLDKFEDAIQSVTSKNSLQGGDIHPMTQSVMNYIKLLADYISVLNVLLTDGGVDDGGDGSVGDESLTPLGNRICLLISHLECKLEEKSKVYVDEGMEYIFLMNNTLYIVQQVMDSELKTLLGDNWVRKHRGQIRQYSLSYLRTTWTKVLSCLKDDGLGGSRSSHSVSRVALKERFKSFNLAFEGIYRTQTSWKVPDSQLREELRISISEKVIPAYRSFEGRFRGELGDGRGVAKYIKYTTEDLENYLSDLFEGLPGSSSHLRRKHGRGSDQLSVKLRLCQMELI